MFNLTRLCILIVLVLTAEGNAEQTIEITLNSQVSPNVAVTLAQIAIGATVAANGDETLQQIVERECGLMPPIYYTFLGDANPSLTQGAASVLPDKTEVILPACAPLPQAKPHTLATGEIISDFLSPATVPFVEFDQSQTYKSLTELYNAAIAGEIDIGAPVDRSVFAGAQTAARLGNELVLAAETGSKVAADPVSWSLGPLSVYPADFTATSDQHLISVTQITDPNRVKAGSTVLLPAQLPQPRTFMLRDGMNYEDAKDAILEAARNDGLQAASVLVAPGQQLSLPTPMTDGNRECVETISDPHNWPLPWDAISSQLARNQKVRDDSTSSSRILVLDTGFDFVGWMPGFPTKYFPPARAIPVDTGVGYGSLQIRTREGVNLATLSTGAKTGSYIVVGKDMRWHGTSVISAALGSRQVEGQHADVTLGIVPASAITAFQQAEPLALGRAIKYAQDNDIKVINYSFTTPNDPGIDEWDRDVLLVVPAGNDGTLVGNLWPARYGGPGNPVITVGGHQPSGKIWQASNRHPNFVDILAPSCSIPVYEGVLQGKDPEPLKTVSAGTSLAAPLVSFVAGLLAAEGLTPVEIKTRIDISAQLNSDAILTTYSGGTLNAPTALSLYSDVLVLRREGDIPVTLRGRFEEESSLTVNICGIPRYLRQVHKVAIYSSPRGEKIRYWTSTNSGLDFGVSISREADCFADEMEMNANFVTDDGVRIQVSATDILDYTRRFSNATN